MAEKDTNQSDSERLVPEGDLIAVKKGSQEKIEQLSVKVAEVQRLYDQTLTDFHRERASSELLQKELESARASTKVVGELQKQLVDRDSVVKGLETKLLELKRSSLATQHSINPDQLVNKTLQQLEVLEEALTLVGKNAKPKKYDAGAVGTDITGSQTTSRELIRQGLEEMKRR